MTFADTLGWAACLMTLTTFAQRRMVPLRAAAIVANVLFIGYAALGHYLPILALHLTLLPINGQRLFLLLAGRSSGRTNSGAEEATLSAHRHSDDPGGGIRRLVRSVANGSGSNALHPAPDSRAESGGRQ